MRPSLSLNLVEPLGGATVFLAGYVGYDIHQRNAILDRERINIQGGGECAARHVRHDVVGHLFAFPERSLGPDHRGDREYARNHHRRLGCHLQHGGRLIPSFGVAQTWSTNSAVQYLTQEYDSTAANAALAYNAGSLGTFSLIGSFTRTDYPNRFFLLPTGPQTDGYNMYSGGMRLCKTTSCPT